ncbi:hypothetical protein PAJ34TS1_40390 [Paenibacillus azoreducens]|uniref:Aldolase n=1 Tax=Paenibacillus azoreducens TaxID=116718 RepID=A0A920CNS2_9BACL|nr:hypothetical protein J34TS1_04200 [Paenibacillus azoreducens]
MFSELVDRAIWHAVRLDAVAVCVNLLLLPGQPELHHQCVANISRLKTECEQYGIPLMVEPLVMLPNEARGGYMVDGDIHKTTALVRQGVELGADVIKADPCDDVSEYHRVIEVASGVPVLVRGGGRASDEEIVHHTAELMKQGAAGIVYGRNVITSESCRHDGCVNVNRSSRRSGGTSAYGIEGRTGKHLTDRFATAIYRLMNVQ